MSITSQELLSKKWDQPDINLHQFILDGEYQNLKLAYWLTTSLEGLLILKNNKSLWALIDKTLLNDTVLHGPFNGTTFIFWLARSKVGREIILQNLEWMSLIDKKTINSQKKQDLKKVLLFCLGWLVLAKVWKF